MPGEPSAGQREGVRRGAGRADSAAGETAARVDAHGPAHAIARVELLPLERARPVAGLRRRPGHPQHRRPHPAASRHRHQGRAAAQVRAGSHQARRRAQNPSGFPRARRRQQGAHRRRARRNAQGPARGVWTGEVRARSAEKISGSASRRRGNVRQLRFELHGPRPARRRAGALRRQPAVFAT